jgi:phage tail protein X
MKVTERLPYETIVVKGEGITPSLLVWRRYKRRALGIVEQLLEMNPEVPGMLMQSPFLPVGTIIKVPIDQRILNGGPVTTATVKVWGDH